MDGLKGSGNSARFNPEPHRPPINRGTVKAQDQLEGRSIPENSKLALVNQELHRPPTSLRETPGNGPTIGLNPLLEIETKPPAAGTQAVDDLINRVGQGGGTTAPPPPPPI